MDGSSRVLACRLLSTYPALCFKEIQQISTEIRLLSSGTFSQTSDLENFAFCVTIVETCYQLSSTAPTLDRCSLSRIVIVKLCL